MIKSKEISGIVLSLLLLACFIGIWLNSVYKQELSALKAEANVIFFKSLEEANDRLFISRSIRHEGANRKHPTWITDTLPGGHVDSMKVSDVIIFEAHGSENDSFLHSQVLEMANRFREEFEDNGDMTISINASSTQSMRQESDSMVVVDFKTTHKNLSTILEEKLESSTLPQLKVKVLANPSFDTLSKNTFITNKGSLGNLFLGTNEYAAAFANYRKTIFLRMIPEYLFGLLLFSAIAAAFIFIYRSLQKERHLAIAKDEFISNMTHEFKTPISVVNVALEGLRNFDVIHDKEKTNEYLDLSKSELKRLSGMIDNVMNLSKLENTPGQQSKGPVNLESALTKVLKNFDLSINDKGQTLKIDIREGNYGINGNLQNIDSIISNLVDNANKYAPEGATITVNLYRDLENIILEISDDGPGIPETYRNQVFDKFFRIPTANIHDVKGHGLGLYYVRELVRRHKGKITVASNENSGTTFKIILPGK